MASLFQTFSPAMNAIPALAAASLLAGITGASPTVDDKVVVEAGRIITMAGDEVNNGVIVIEDGRITAIGPADEVEIPWDAPVVGGPEFTAFPGFVEAHTSNGLDRSNENIDVAPFLSLRDSVDPVSFYFEDCLRWGITTVGLQHGANCVVGARGMIVRPTGMTVAEMAVRPVHGIKVSATPKSGKSPATQAQTLRLAFADLQRYLEDLVQQKRDERAFARREALFQGREHEEPEAPGRAMGGSAWKVEGLELVPREEIDQTQLPLLEMVEGEYDIYLECNQAREVRLALEVARDNGFLERTTLVCGPTCFRAVDQIAESGCDVILTGSPVYVDVDPLTGDEEEIFVPNVFAEAGIRFAMSSQNSTTNSLWFRAAVAIGLGMSREDALAAVTTTPAEILGLSSDIGTLETGKLGNVVLFSGDPLSMTSWVEHVIIEGEEAYDRSEDTRVRHLLEAEEPRGAAAGQADVDDEDDSDQDGE